MAVSLIGRVAAAAPASVYLLVGDGGRSVARALARAEEVRIAASPREASLLVVAGRIPPALRRAARAIHDQISAPRATVIVGDDSASEALPGAVTLSEPSGLLQQLRSLHRDLMRGVRPSEPPLGAPDNPVRWQGVGTHGQGGEGMMGGHPYGRPMAMTADDLRDGLALDPLTLPLGPFLPWLPPGLTLDVVLQGDVVQEVTPQVLELVHPDEPEAMERARASAVPLAEIEIARASHHLEAVADLLELHELAGLAARTRRLADDLRPSDEQAIDLLARRLRRTGALTLATRGIGLLDAKELDGMGPVARAAGRREDARSDDPAYQALDFAPITHQAGDAEARWKQRLAEAAQALGLARRAGEVLREPGPEVEGCRGVLAGKEAGAWLAQLRKAAIGQPLDAFVTTVVSLDLDPAALPSSDGAERAAPSEVEREASMRAHHQGDGDDGRKRSEGAR